ncbi:S-layer homology domain protein [anaerobic digester metagenome]|jgi:hypothetical protein|uniref:S-layer homology domain-containing protein n=1 Tax=Oscillibacter ruminantium TaxID=1263547 RepID=UPI002B21850D|nr:S-layer homology domain-containing protein [Oscillibacter ruminantium]MEA5041239.1 S-layer homology domain-containing protein [Oscillibacter ruminantium]
MKKRICKLVSLLLCAVMLAIPAAAVATEETQIAPLGPVLLTGTLSQGEKGSLLLSNQERGDTILHISDETRILNAVSGEPVALDKIRDGETAYVYAGPAMTLSLPPQTTAVLILTKIPADFAVPSYQQVAAVNTVNDDGITVTTQEGKQMTIPASAKVTPYLTKNIVTFRDLIPGTWFLAWNGSNGAVEKAMLFAYDGLPFTDVTADHWAYDDILSASSKGLLNCDKMLAFRPSEALTRAEMVKALYQMAGSPVVIQSMPKFTDVQNGGDYINALTWAVGNKLVGGYSDNTFRPDAPVTRQQLAVFLYRWEQHRGGGFQGAWMFQLDYPDRESISEYAYESVAWCSVNGVLTGRSDGTLAPNATVTRAAAAAMFQRYLATQTAKGAN